MKRIFFTLCLAILSAGAQAATPCVTVSSVASLDTTIIGQKIEVPKDPTVIVSTVVFAPGAKLPVHKHLYPHYAYVLEGTLTIINVETGKSFDIVPGQFLAEMQNTWHYGVNNGKTPVRLLIVDHVPKGVTSNVVAMDPKEAAKWGVK